MRVLNTQQVLSNESTKYATSTGQ